MTKSFYISLIQELLISSIYAIVSMQSVVKSQNARKFKSSRTVMALVLREMATTYGRSSGGYIWAILEPVASTTLLAMIFSLAFRAPPIGTSFILFYATGLLPYSLYMNVSKKVSASFDFSRTLLFYPGVLYIDALIARWLLNFMTQTIVFAIIMKGIIVFFALELSFDFAVIIMSLVLAGSLALGIGVLNAFLNAMFPIWARIWTVLNRPMLILSCVLFLLDDIPEPYRGILWYNPLVHITALMRAGFYASYEAAYVSGIYVMAVSSLCLVSGLLLLGRYHRQLINN